MRQSRLCGLAACVALTLSGCGDPDITLGRRQSELRGVVAAVRDKPEGRYSAADVPAEVRPRRLLGVYVDARGAVALVFASETTVDLNPAFVYIGFDTPDPEAAAREVCKKAALTYRNPFKEPGWYRATGQ